ncbi:MAG: diphosphomevalonate decarboxylase [Candidatus Micrarchaeia archaeon]|jgi:diphosphomevalonate decarboxylase
MKTLISTVEATPNIAVVKYWGKRDESLILPTNSSMSFTMGDNLKTRTTVMFSEKFGADEAWLQGKKLEGKDLGEIVKILDLAREKAGGANVKLRGRFVSMNGFPTAAGMASSAAGMAALACAATRALGLKLDQKELSIIARRGSGSACRSVMGGFVEWKKGEKADGSDSYAVQVAPASHWPQIRNVIAIVDAGKKKVSSRAGMRQTIATSPLYKARLEYVPKVVEEMRKAVLARDFAKFAELTMRESSNMHAVMLDTWPPITYLNDISREIMYAVREELNAEEIRGAYTFDAGPNAHIYTLEQHVPAVREMLSGIRGVQKIIECRVGEGPRYLEGEKEQLIDPATGKVREHSFDEKENRIIIGGI